MTAESLGRRILQKAWFIVFSLLSMNSIVKLHVCRSRLYTRNHTTKLFHVGVKSSLSAEMLQIFTVAGNQALQQQTTRHNDNITHQKNEVYLMILWMLLLPIVKLVLSTIGFSNFFCSSIRSLSLCKQINLANLFQCLYIMPQTQSKHVLSSF